MPTHCLKEFAAIIPSCLATTRLTAVLDMFRHQQCDRLVMVSKQQRPLGVLHLNRLLPYFIVGTQEEYRGAVPASAPEAAEQQFSHLPSPALQQPLSALKPSLWEPLEILPADLTLEQFWPYLQKQLDNAANNANWALVDFAGKFLGLLDSQRLLQFLATHSQTALANSGSSQEPEKTQPEFPDALTLLVELLERLPLPLMLQTSTGETVKQNLAWCRHFGSLADPDSLRRDAAALLESVPPQDRDSETNENPKLLASLSETAVPLKAPKREGKRKRSKKEEPEGTRSRGAQEQQTPGDYSIVDSPSSIPHSQLAEVVEFQPAPALSQLCQLGTSPDTCICVCPMQNGPERVWQFVKIPLGSALSSSNLLSQETEMPTDAGGNEPSLASFRLANLSASAERTSTASKGETRDFAALYKDLWLVLAQDVTEQQQVAKELSAKNADLMQLNRLKDEFLACISHELKTPLTAVLGLSSLLKDQLLGDLNERQARYVRLIHQSGRHLMTVVNDILDLTRIETGQLELTLGPVSIAAVCDRAYQQAQQLQLMQDGSEEEYLDTACPEHPFTLEIEPGLDTLIADELRLRQMLVNLLSNAIKFTDVSGSIGLRVSRWEGWVAFTVWDTGIGIPEEKQHLIFQKFQQLENPLIRQYQGTGLGLVLTQRLAHLHGGDVSFVSKIGQGSQFTLLLPPSPPQKAAGERESGRGREYPYSIPHAPSSASPMPSRLVLIVEATPRFIDDLTEQLTGLGYRVVIARSGTEAVAKARALQPKVIFLNPLLPLLSGWDVLTLLKSNDQTCHIPVIVTATRADKQQARNNRADDFLSLPVQLDSLQQSLERLTLSAEVPQEQQPHSQIGLTILRLSISEESGKAEESAGSNTSRYSRTPPDLSSLLHRHHCRVLEADDLEQAHILARIWQPDVILLEGEVTNPLAYLQQMSQHPALATLPLVTLDRAIAQAASQVQELSVFPCLEPPGSPARATALLQAIQLAAGMSWKPSILAMDISMLPDLLKPVALLEQQLRAYDAVAPDEQGLGIPEIADAGKKRTEWLRALIQYLETAGLKGAIAHSWSEVLQQIQHRSVDLLLIHVGDSLPSPAVVKALYALRQFADRPPILVLERRSPGCESQTPGESLSGMAASLSSPVRMGLKPCLTLAPVLQDIATQIVPATLSMEELLERIRQALGQPSTTMKTGCDRS